MDEETLFVISDSNNNEMLAIREDGFYLKCVKVEDTKEGYAEFYKEFKKWLLGAQEQMMQPAGKS
jgi:hypothetical protein